MHWNHEKIDLGAIDPLELPSLPLDKKADLPDCPAIYFAISGSGEILYVGRTAALCRRWISHHRFKQLNDLGNVKLAWLQCEEPSILKTLEARLICALKPKLNEQLPSSKTLFSYFDVSRKDTSPIQPQGSKLGWAILTVLIDSPCSGYDLAKRFDGSVGFFWSASHQQIYRELSKLEDNGWITAEIILQEERPDKKLYRVTESGEQQLNEWIATPCEPTPIKDDLLVKLFAGYVAPRETILAELEHHRASHQQKLSTYKKLEQQYFQNPEQLAEQAKFQYLTLLNGVIYETHWLAWCEEAIKLLS